MTIDFQLKGLFNQQSLIQNDNSNIANSDNHTVFSQVLCGNQKSEMFDYLLNMNQERLNDVKSIMAYNGSNRAALINEAQIYDEITNGNSEELVFLSKNPQKLNEKLENVLKHRHSTRLFISHEISFENFSTIIQKSFGIAPRKMIYGEVETTTRYYASGGGLYPIKVYIYCNDVQGIEKGFYLYQPISHTLLAINKTDNIATSKFFEGGNIDTENMNFTVFFGYRINTTYLKYGELSLLLGLVEVGIISHNFDLVLTSLGYTGCAIAGYNKTYIENLLNFDHVNEHILFSNICGKE